ncbi:MAG: hypothetical protein IAI50_09160 [Candidatus Eremiobacteraeota bacterium]|nr:hypothetical protein [Candidatus Eremiobacteraeota bacterium]
MSSQAFGVINAINEYRLGTIPATVAFIQWAIEASIIAVLLSLSSNAPSPAAAIPAYRTWNRAVDAKASLE